MSPATDTIEGVVLCTVGGDRVAVLAGDVAAIEAPDARAPYAGRGFGSAAQAPATSKLLRAESAGLVVDAVEVHPERLPLLRVPPGLGRVRALLLGFVEVTGTLWPLVSLPALARHLEVTP